MIQQPHVPGRRVCHLQPKWARGLVGCMGFTRCLQVAFCTVAGAATLLQAADIDFPEDTDPSAIVRYLKSSDRKDQERGLQAAQQVSTVTAELSTALLAFVKDEDPAFRSWSMIALRHSSNLSVDHLQLLAEGLGDRDDYVRVYCADLLLTHGSYQDKALALLRSLASTAEKEMVRQEAARILKKFSKAR